MCLLKCLALEAKEVVATIFWVLNTYVLGAKDKSVLVYQLGIHANIVHTIKAHWCPKVAFGVMGSWWLSFLIKFYLHPKLYPIFYCLQEST